MKTTNIIIIAISLMSLTACGWSENQKESARNSIGDGFSTGLSNTGATVDEKVKEEWVNCVVDKASEKFTFDEFTKNMQIVESIQEECANEVGLYDAITSAE